MPEAQMDFDGYEPPIPRTEVVLDKWVEVNATMIDPETGAKLDRIANKVGAEIRRSGDSQLVVISKEGLALEKEIGETELVQMLSDVSSAMRLLVERLLPSRLTKAFLYGMPNSRDTLIAHATREMNELREGTVFSWGRVSLLSIGGQSMAVRVVYDHASGSREFVVKTTSPLALTIEPIQAMILCPLTSELLRREVLCTDQRFQRESEEIGIRTNRGLVATPYFMVERYVAGQPPQAEDPANQNKIRAFLALLRDTLHAYTNTPPGADIEKFMSGVSGLDAQGGDGITAEWPVAPERRRLKVDNFIEEAGGTLCCFDPFQPEPAFSQADKLLDGTTKAEGHESLDPGDKTTPFTLHT